jgi:hypothetical protein
MLNKLRGSKTNSDDVKTIEVKNSTIKVMHNDQRHTILTNQNDALEISTVQAKECAIKISNSNALELKKSIQSSKANRLVSLKTGIDNASVLEAIALSNPDLDNVIAAYGLNVAAAIASYNKSKTSHMLFDSPISCNLTYKKSKTFGSSDKTSIEDAKIIGVSSTMDALIVSYAEVSSGKAYENILVKLENVCIVRDVLIAPAVPVTSVSSAAQPSQQVPSSSNTQPAQQVPSSSNTQPAQQVPLSDNLIVDLSGLQPPQNSSVGINPSNGTLDGGAKKKIKSSKSKSKHHHSRHSDGLYMDIRTATEDLCD